MFPEPDLWQRTDYRLSIHINAEPAGSRMTRIYGPTGFWEVVRGQVRVIALQFFPNPSI